MTVFRWHIPAEWRFPILVSVPHCGTAFPEEVRKQMRDHGLESMDTDWYVDRLYNFCQDIGIGLIAASMSRYVVDLNRPAQGGNLYNDGRQETQVLPTRSFDGEPLYQPHQEPDQGEISRRIERYHQPYYQELTHALAELKRKHGCALLFDAHSIKRNVPKLTAEPFPELIVGDVNGTSCSPEIANICLKHLRNTSWTVGHNTVFKGGNITRTFGDPKNGIHAIQLEMIQDLYMDEATVEYIEEKANTVRDVLKNIFLELGNAVQQWR